MMSREEAIEILRKELPYLSSRYGVKRIGLFGSIAKGDQKGSSDIDVLVEFEKPIGLRFMELAEYIEEILHSKVDILTPEGIRSIRIKEVARDIEQSIVYV